MANNGNRTLVKFLEDNLLSVAVIAALLAMVIPMPTILLDFAMAMNLVFGIIIILNVLYTSKSTNLTSFPRIIVFTTLYGLVVNISSTRLILSKGMAFDGKMVRTFSTFVTGNSETGGILIGLVQFIILIVVQVVMSKSSTRVSEVAARFALDSIRQSSVYLGQKAPDSRLLSRDLPGDSASGFLPSAVCMATQR